MGLRPGLIAAVIAALALPAGIANADFARGTRDGAATGYCSGSMFAATRNPLNPLVLALDPGVNPLVGAHFFVPGPRHGLGAGAIARLLGLDPASFPEDESWVTFRQDLDTGALSRRFTDHPLLAHKVNLLEKIAAEPEALRFSIYSGGGGPGAIHTQVGGYFCGEAAADPGSVPLITTYFLYASGYCPSASQIRGGMPAFKRRIDELASATGRHPAVFLLELDAIGSSGCMRSTGALPLWEDEIRYEINRVAALPHTVVYIEGGYSDVERPAYTASVLNAVGVRKIRGFFTNDTHHVWTIDEVRWGQKVSRLTHGAHFVVNTASNGRGPKVNPGGVGGVEDLCNPPGGGVGPRLTTHTGFEHTDAFVWTGTPGRSGGQCHRGDPAAGVFGVNLGLDLARRSNAQLGPGFPSLPY